MKKFHQLSFKSILTAGAVFVSRLGYLPANVNPVGGFGFFGHSGLFWLTIVGFDTLIGGFYPGFWVTYVGFAMYPLLGKLTRGKLCRQLVLLPLASLLFFLISNLGVWWYWYPRTLEGLFSCYVLAIPFYKRTLVGDLVFGYGYLAYKQLSLHFLKTSTGKVKECSTSYLI